MESNFKSALCTNCGSELKLDTTKKQSFCASCGSKIHVSDSVNKFRMIFPDRAKKAEELAKTDGQPTATAQAPAVEGASATVNTESENSLPLLDATVVDEDENSLSNLYIKAQEHLNAREYFKAGDIYTKIITEINPKEYAAHWGMYLVDERNFNFEEKLLQCFSCFTFRAGSELIKKEILANQNLEKALTLSPPDMKKKYSEEAQRHAENIYNLYREGSENLTTVIERRFDLILGHFETIGITSIASKIAFPAGVSIKFMSDTKLYVQFSVNKMNTLYFDVLNVSGNTLPIYSLWHYRHVLANPDNGILSWSEFRNFKNCQDHATIVGELDQFHKIGYVILAVWRDKLIMRSGNKVYFLKSTTFNETVTQTLHRCYNLSCVPVVEDPNSWNTGHKASEFYYVQSIALGFESNKKSRWIRKNAGACYIATSVYGDYNAPEVLVLRRFRDNVLLKSFLGRLFVDVYYAVSPPVAKRLKSESLITKAFRHILNKIVSYLSK